MTWIKCAEKNPPLKQIIPLVWKGIIVIGEYANENTYIYLFPSNMFQQALVKFLPILGSEISPTHWMETPEVPNELD